MSEWLRVTRRRRCPICGKPDWCLVKRDASAAICPRVDVGAKKFIPGSGYLHVLEDHWRPARPKQPAPKRTRPVRDFGELASEYESRATSTTIAPFAESLGVSEYSLRRLGIGLKTAKCWTFPMENAEGKVIGIRVRHEDGKKWAETGSRAGLFVPCDRPDSEVIVICEGATDTAAILDAGYDAIGRPSCLGCLDMTAEILRRKQAVILADADGPGRKGARQLAKRIRRSARSVRIIAPHWGRKDAREWKPCRQELGVIIHNTPVE